MSFTMTPWAHDARYFAGFEQLRTSQTPSLTGSKYNSLFLLVIENSSVYLAAPIPGALRFSLNIAVISKPGCQLVREIRGILSLSRFSMSPRVAALP
jgi:hypothetical protein